MYVQAVVQQANARGVILAPQEGVSRDRRGQPIALVVNAQNVVEQRSLTILQDHGNQWVVSEGLRDGDRIVVEGATKTGPGMTVIPEERKTEATQGSGAQPGGAGAPNAKDGKDAAKPVY
jgi:membrane fusion protein (multidrug efflux system)